MAKEDIKKHEYKKGVSGNPNGRPKGKSTSKIIRELLESVAPEEIRNAKFVKEFLNGNGMDGTNQEVLACQLLYKALVKGDMQAIREVLDRDEGRAKQAIELAGKDGDAIEHRVEWRIDKGEAKTETN